MRLGRTLWNRRVPMRDGVTLAADVVLPEGTGPWPAVVNRTPYMRGGNLRPSSWMRLVEYGYAIVVVDVRGRGDSGGEFTPFVHDAPDGHDTIEWVAAQPWCTERVGMVGASYAALTQWWAAKAAPAHLRCIVPQAVGAVTMGPRWSADTGVPVQYWIWWFNLVTGRTVQHASAPSWEANYDRLPLRRLHEWVGTAREWWPKYVAGEIDWLGPDAVLSGDEWAHLDVPALVGVGWWDDQSTMATWMALKASPGGPRARLLIGAWDHIGNNAPRPVLGGVDVSASAIDTIAYIERFLARHLKDEGEDDLLPRCRVFRTGAMRWETLDDWPAPGTVASSWHLDARGALVPEDPAPGEDSYRYNPEDPVRDFTSLGSFASSDPPLDGRHLLRRPDVLVYTSEELAEAIDVSGEACFEGHVSLDCPETDIAVSLHDVHPDGRSIYLGPEFPEIRRIAGGDGPVAVRIPVTWLHHRFARGHRIRVAITSSAYPFYARNLNGGEPWADAAHPRPARVTLHRAPRDGCRLVLPVEGT
jgi:putative CocE/NonD family hydrolase